MTALDGQGRSKLREGFHVSCDTDTDCHSRCGIHPVNGYSYTCTHHVRLYDYQGVNETFPDGRVLQRPNHTPFTHKQLTPARSTYRSYYINQDDQFDIHNTSTGVCTDVRLDYMHTGCESRSGAAAMFGVVGCEQTLRLNHSPVPASDLNMTGTEHYYVFQVRQNSAGRVRSSETRTRTHRYRLLLLTPGRATLVDSGVYCGVSIQRSGPDFLDVSIAGSAFDFPRILSEQVEVDGVLVPKVQCEDLIDCNIKCTRFERSSRAGGFPVPSGCALCSPLCPSDM